MVSARSASLVVAVLSLAACTSETPIEPPTGDGGAPPEGCVPGERTLEDGSCLPAGIAEGTCGEGFAPHETEGCNAIMPEAPCAPGWMAVPGDTECHEVAACPSGAWGELPSEAGIQYVDVTYANTDSDGTQSKPWTSLADAVAATSPGGVIALAAGDYPAGYEVTKAVRIYGKCPMETTIVDVTTAQFAIAFTTVGASGSELHDLAISGQHLGVGIDGATSALLERVWIHDTGGTGVHVQGSFGPITATVRSSLIESVRANGVYALGATAKIERSAIRDVLLQTPFGVGALAQSSYGRRGVLDVSGSVVERCPLLGIGFQGADGSVVDTLLRDHAFLDSRGAALGVADEPNVSSAQVDARGLVIERTGPRGIAVAGSMLTLDATVVRDTAPFSDGNVGHGIGIEDSLVDGRRSNVTVTRSLLLRNREIGIFVAGSDLLLESVAVRDTLFNQATPSGRGVGVQSDPMTGSTSTATIRWSAFTGNKEVSLFISGQQATVEDTLVRDTQLDALGISGRGIEVRDDVDTGARGNLTLRRSRIEASYVQGILVLGADLQAESVTVAATHKNPNDGLFGDGVAVALGSESGPLLAASATLHDCRIEASDRAGVGSFGASVSIATTVIECSAFAFASEPYLGQNATLIDEGGNDCGCGAERTACKAVSANLQPPTPVEPTNP